MLSHSQTKWAVRGAALLLWAAAAASGAYWVLKLMGGSGSGPAAPVAARGAPPADPAAVARLLGAVAPTTTQAPVATLASRFSLVGVAAGRSRGGAALIVVDGKPAKPFRVGNAVDDGIWLQAVEGRKAVLAATRDGPALLTLELPQLRR